VVRFPDPSIPTRCSVVIPARNAAAHLREAITSVHRQSTPPTEVVVVDDGSSDDTARIATEHGARVVRLPTSMGPSHARNRGIAEAQGDLIAFLDADDVWLPGHLEASVALLNECPAGLCFAPVRVFGTVNTLVVPPCESGRAMDMTEALLEENFIVQSSVVVRRNVLPAVGAYDESLRLAEDYDLWLRLSGTVDFAMIATATVMRRLHPEQASELRRLDMIAAAWRVRVNWLQSTQGLERLSHARRLDLLERATRRELSWAIWTGDREHVSRARHVLADVYHALMMPLPRGLQGGIAGDIIREKEELQCALQNVRRWVHRWRRTRS
jgi:glycosyltransferase involved in cell wall biosynthesis